MMRRLTTEAEPRVTVLGERSWSGFRARVVQTTKGYFSADPMQETFMMFHIGAPATVRCNYDGVRDHRVQSRGCFDVIPEGCAPSWEDEDPTASLNVFFHASRIAAAADGLRLKGGAHSIQPQISRRDDRLFATAQLLQSEIHAEHPDDLFADSIAAAMAMRLLRQPGVLDPVWAHNVLSRRQLHRVMDYIAAHLDQNLRLSQLSGVVGLSESHFRALFRQTTGQPIHQFVVELRLQRARDLLASGELPMAEVALECGFCDQSHMAKAMRRKWKVTPSQLKKPGLGARSRPTGILEFRAMSGWAPTARARLAQ